MVPDNNKTPPGSRSNRATASASHLKFFKDLGSPHAALQHIVEVDRLLPMLFAQKDDRHRVRDLPQTHTHTHTHPPPLAQRRVLQGLFQKERLHVQGAWSAEAPAFQTAHLRIQSLAVPLVGTSPMDRSTGKRKNGQKPAEAACPLCRRGTFPWIWLRKKRSRRGTLPMDLAKKKKERSCRGLPASWQNYQAHALVGHPELPHEEVVELKGALLRDEPGDRKRAPAGSSQRWLSGRFSTREKPPQGFQGGRRASPAQAERRWLPTPNGRFEIAPRDSRKKSRGVSAPFSAAETRVPKRRHQDSLPKCVQAIQCWQSVLFKDPHLGAGRCANQACG